MSDVLDCRQWQHASTRAGPLNSPLTRNRNAADVAIDVALRLVCCHSETRVAKKSELGTERAKNSPYLQHTSFMYRCYRRAPIEMSQPGVLVVGASTATARLVSVLCASNAFCSSVAGSGGCNSSSCLRIDNKYYSVDVEVATAATGDVPSASLPDSLQAMILMLDAADCASFEAVKPWADASSAEIRLLVANWPLAHAASLAAGPRPAWLEGVMDWATEQSFEYVEACCEDAGADAALSRHGDLQAWRNCLTCVFCFAFLRAFCSDAAV